MNDPKMTERGVRASRDQDIAGQVRSSPANVFPCPQCRADGMGIAAQGHLTLFGHGDGKK